MKINTRISRKGAVFQPSRGGIVNAEMAKGLAEAAEALSTEIKRVTPVATGRMRAAIRVIPGVGSGKIVQSGEWYATPLDTGTNASHVPLAPLEAWVSAKLGLSGVEATRVAVQISKARSRSPQKAKRFFIATYRKTRNFLVKQYIEPIAERTAGILG
jgi:hypothetical protein